MGKIEDTFAAEPASRPVYTGMEWTTTAGGKRWIARSSTTPASYAIETVDDGLWVAREGFPDFPGRPNVEIGRFLQREIAMTAAERRDFAFWSSEARRGGLDPVFMGSPDHVSDFVSSLADYERGDLLDMIAGGYALPDGRDFTHQASFFPARKTAMKQERNGEYTLTLAIRPEDLPLWLMQAVPGSSLVAGLVGVEKDSDEVWMERAGQALKRSFMLARDNDFHGWLAQKYDRWGLLASAMMQTSEEVEEAVAETLRRIIGCPTRRDLATNRDAILRLEKIDREFYLDMSRGFSADR